MQTFLKRAWAEIHLDRAKRNYERISTLLKDGSELMAVVKANAYGHDDGTMAPFFQNIGIKYFAVSNIHEAEKIRAAGVKGEILILGYTSPEYTEQLADFDIVTAVVSSEHAKALNDKAQKPVRCHVTIDTGMGRIGLREETPEECADRIEEIISLPNLKVEGIFTHLSVADSDDDSDIAYTMGQANYITEVNEILKNRGVCLRHVHFLNSAGGTYYSTGKSTLSRFGIMLYGLYPNPELALPIELEPVMDLKAEVAHVKTVEPDACISYGRTFRTDRPTKIATVTIGYADGYSRLLSGVGEVLLHGKRAKIIGRVCMDQMMVDATGIDVEVGDTATLIGRDGNEVITADGLAKLYGTIGYEVVCGISKRIPRVVMNDGEIINVLEY